MLDPWQRRVLDGGLGERPDGRWAAREVCCWVPRQNGKGAIIEARVLAGLFLFGERKILWSAHEYKTAQEGFLRIKELIESAPEFDARVERYWEGSGEQGIELRPRKRGEQGQRLKFIARSRGSGRGFSGDLIILDEAQELNLLQMKALYSTMSAKSITGNPQVWYFGTPPEDPAAWVYGLRRDGEAGKERLAYFDWGLGEVDVGVPFAERLERYADRDLWYQANPGLGIRISEEFCEDELSRLQEGFASERLGLWLPPAMSGAGVISDELWRGQVCAPRRPADVALCIQVNHSRTHTAIMAVGPRDDGGMLMSVVAYEPGTDWVVERAVQLKQRWNPIGIAVQDKGPTGSLLKDMARAGLKPAENRDEPKRGDLAIPYADDVAAAYGMFIDAIVQRRLFHLAEAPLNQAVREAETRPLSGATAWDYKVESAAPLIGATLANWLYVTWIDKVTVERDEIGVW